MCSSTGVYFTNQSFEEEKPASVESIHHKQIPNHTAKETGDANPLQGPNRTLLAMVIIACLISLAVLLLTISMFGKIGDRCNCAADKGQCTNLGDTHTKGMEAPVAKFEFLKDLREIFKTNSAQHSSNECKN